ncbi:MAG: TonB-dependent receptor, partial [Bacteroidota bacterium]
MVYYTSAQNCSGTLYGEVVDFHDGTFLSEAVVSLIETNQSQKTDNRGAFVFEGLCDGFYELEVSHPECRSRIIYIRVKGKTHQNITLEHHLEALGEVVVEDRKTQQQTISSIEGVVHTEILEKYGSATLGDALKEVSGVSSLNTGNAIVKPMIHGLHSSRILIINNGVRLQDQEWGVEHAPNLDINAATRINVVKGAAALQYGGDAVGGVIVVHPEKLPVKDTLYGKTILSTSDNGRGGSVTSEVTKSYENAWHWKVQGTLKRFGDVEAPHYVLSNTGVFENDFSLALGKNKFTDGFNVFYSYYHTEIGILRTSHIGSVEDLIRAINSNTPLRIEDFTHTINAPKQQVTHHLAKFNYFKRFQSLGKLSLQYAYQQNNRFEFDIRRGDDKAKPSVALKLRTHTLEAQFKADAAADYKIHSGIALSYQNNFPDPETGVRRLIPDYDKYDIGAFIDGSYHIGNTITAEAGLRYDYSHINAKKFYLKSRWEERNYNMDYSDIIIGDFGTQWLTNPKFNFHNLAAVTGIRYTPVSSLSVLFNYSITNRNPNPAELFSDGLHHSAAIIELGNIRFDKETAHKISTAVKGDFRPVTFEVAPHLSFINNFILLQPSGVEFTIRGAFPVWEYTQTNARLFGLDLSTITTLSPKFNLESRFSYIRGDDTTNNIPLIDMPPVN